MNTLLKPTLKPMRVLPHELNRDLGADFDSDMDKIVALQREVGPWVGCLGASASVSEKAFATAQEMGGLIVSELGLPVATGHGPRLMAGFNLGAKLAGGISVGIGLLGLPTEQVPNPHCNRSVFCKTTLARQHGLLSGSQAVIIAPEGSIGTVFELGHQIIEMRRDYFDPDTPLVVIDNVELWKGFLLWAEKELVGRNLLKKDELKKILVADSTRCAIDLLKERLFI